MYFTNLIIDFAKQTIDKNFIVSAPFNITMDTPEKKLEKYAVDNYHELLFYKTYTPFELKRLIKMRKELKKMFSHEENIKQALFKKGWFKPFSPKDQNLIKIKVEQVGAKYYDNNNTPLLDIQGIVYFDMKTMLYLFFKKRFVMVKIEKHSLPKAEIIFMKNIPRFLFYQHIITMRNKIKDLFLYELKNTKSTILKKLEKDLNIKRLHRYNVLVEFKENNKDIEIIVDDPEKFVQAGMATNPVYAIGSRIAAKKIWDKQMKKKIANLEKKLK